MPSLSLTILFLAAYAVISLVIGLLSGRNETEDEFMIAGRRVHGIQMMATMAAGWFDGVTLSVFLAYVYQYGFGAISLFIGIALGFLLFRHFAQRIKTKADEIKAYSMPEFFSHELGPRNGMIFSLVLVTQFAGYLVINFIVAGKVLSALLPSIPYSFAVAIGAAIILTYLLLAGFKAVVRTDFFQLLIMIVMTFLAAAFFAGRVQVTASEFDFARIGAGNAIGFLVLAGFNVMVAPDIWQRVFAARDAQTLRRGLAYTAIILPLLAVVIAVVGFATKQNIPGIPPEDALVKAFTVLLPPGVMEFAMVLLYAVSLSSSDTVTFVVASIITRDLKNYTRRFDDESMRKITRIVMIVFVFLAMLIAINFQQIIQVALSLGSLNLSLFPVVFATMFWRLNRAAVFWSLVLALLTVVVLSATQQLTPETAVLSLPVAAISLILLQLLAAWFQRRRVNGMTNRND